MKVILLIISIFLPFLPISAQQKNKPSIDSVIVSTQVINIGLNNDDVASFEVINNSSRAVDIKGIRASCSCISLKYDDGAVASGEKRKVLVELNNANASNYYIYVSVFDKVENKGRTLLIKLAGKQSENSSKPSNDVSIAPSVLEFKNVSVGKTAESIVVIRNQGKKDVFIRQIIEPCTCVSVEYDKGMIKPGESKKVKVKFTGRPDPVEFDMMVMLSNSSRPYIVKIKN